MRQDYLKLTLVQTEEQLEELACILMMHDVVAFDFETNGKKPQDKDFKVVGASFAVDPIRGWYVPFGHKVPRQASIFAPPLIQLSKELVLRKLDFVWNKKLVAHNIKYEIQCMQSFGLKPEATIHNGKIYFDTFAAQKILDDRIKNCSLKNLIKLFLNEEPYKLKDVLADENPDFTYVPLDIALKYAGPDATNCFKLYQIQEPKLKGQTPLSVGSNNILYNFEVPMSVVIADMERVGMRLDEKKIHQMYEQSSAKCDELEQSIHKSLLARCGDFDEQFGKFTCTKPAVVRSALFEVYGLPYPPGTKQDPKVGKDELQAILEHRSVVDSPKFEEARSFLNKLLEFRKVHKIKSTYTLNLLEKRVDGILYPEFNSLGAKTGRGSSNDPNGQNLPAGGDENDPYRIREAFLPPVPGWEWVLADLMSAEMRGMAALSECPVLKNIVLGNIDLRSNNLGCQIKDPDKMYQQQLKTLLDEGVDEERAVKEAWHLDIHKYTGASAFGISYDDVTKKQRKSAKSVNFGIIYGISKFGLAAQIGCSVKEAEKFIDSYMNTYPGVKSWIDTIKRQVYKEKMISTVQGRYRQVPKAIHNEPPNKYGAVYRWAQNHPIQGLIAYLIKSAMIKVRRRLYDAGLLARQAMQIHDEIAIASPPDETHQVGEILTDSMNTVFRGVPIFTDGYRVQPNLQK